MKKKSLLTVLAATTAISGVAVVSQPSDTEAATSAKSQVAKAEKLAQKLAAEINYDKRKKMYPKSPLGLPNSNIYKQTKDAYNQALKAVKKTKGNEKKVLQARIDKNVKTTINYTVRYINAVNTGRKVLAQSKALDSNVKAYQLNSTTKKSYEALNANLKELNRQIKYVYGSATRNALTKTYVNNSTYTYNTAKFAFGIKSNTDNLAKALEEGNYTKAQYYKDNIDKWIANNNKNKNKKYEYVYVTSTLYKKLAAAYKPLVAQLNNRATTYTAVSTNASNPTQFGGTESKPLTINNDVVIVAGEGKYMKLQNVIVNGDVIIKGDITGAGTVTLDNVKVNETNSKGGQIIVDDVAEHSLYLNGVQADDVVVNDANGSNIVAQSGTQVANLIVSKKAGATGTVTLESVAANAFGTVTVSSNGNSASSGIVIKGDYSNSKLIVNGEDQKVTVAQGTKVNELEVQSNAVVSAEEGATVTNITIAAESEGGEITLSGSLKNVVVVVKNANAKIIVPTGTIVGEIKKDPSVTGEVKVDNQGVINKAEEGITVDGNKPVEVVKPDDDDDDQTPSPGDPDLLITVTGTESITVGNNAVVDLRGKDDSFRFTGITFHNATIGSQLIITSVQADDRSLPAPNIPISVTATTEVTTRDILGSLDRGTPGVSLGALRNELKAGHVVVQGVVQESEKDSYNVSVTIYLGSRAPE